MDDKERLSKLQEKERDTTHSSLGFLGTDILTYLRSMEDEEKKEG